MTSSTLIILNPHAGGGRAGTVWREIEPILWNHMGDLIVAVTQHPNEVARHIEQAYTVGVRRVIALGGDGTNHSLVNALAVFNQQHPDEPMIYGNIPVGTGRDWARGQGLPFTEAKPIADWIIGAKPTPTDIRTLEINGSEAAIGARPRGSDTGLGQARYIAIRQGARVCNFALVSEGADQDRQIEAMVQAARTFRTLTSSEAASLQPYRLRIVSPAGSTPAQLAARMPYPDLRMERLLVLNAAQVPADLTGRSEIKTVQP